MRHVAGLGQLGECRQRGRRGLAARASVKSCSSWAGERPWRSTCVVCSSTWRVPDGERGGLAEVEHRLAVRADAGLGGGQARRLADPRVAARDDRARREALDVPLPRAGQRLVEVGDVEDEVALGGGEHAEVRHVGVPAGLHHDPGRRRGRQVVGHHDGRAPEERERRREHPLPAQRDELGHPPAVLRPRGAPPGRPGPRRGVHAAWLERGTSARRSRPAARRGADARAARRPRRVSDVDVISPTVPAAAQRAPPGAGAGVPAPRR